MGRETHSLLSGSFQASGEQGKSTEEEQGCVHVAYFGRTDAANLTQLGRQGSFVKNGTSRRQCEEGVGVSRENRKHKNSLAYSGVFWKVRMQRWWGVGKVRIKGANEVGGIHYRFQYLNLQRGTNSHTVVSVFYLIKNTAFFHAVPVCVNKCLQTISYGAGLGQVLVIQGSPDTVLPSRSSKSQGLLYTPDPQTLHVPSHFCLSSLCLQSRDWGEG